MRWVEDDRRGVEQAKVGIKPGDCRLDHLRRPAEAAVAAVRSDGDGIEVRHGAALSLRAQRSNPRVAGVDCFVASLLAMTA